jgi:uncharacterized membrane protein
VVNDSTSIAGTWISAVLTGSWPDVSRIDVVVGPFCVILIFVEILGSV